jgi:hypothetical protein
MAEPWFDPNTFGAWFGSIVGGGMGTLCGLLGAAAGTLAPLGRGKAVILGVWYVFLAIGAGLLILGVVAWLMGQPYGIWYGPVLSGAIITVSMGSLLPMVKQRYRQAEQRRIDAEGVRVA